MSLEIAIIGAGIGGLAAACTLRARGYAATVYEQAPALGEIGAGLQISANGAEVLEAIGVQAAARAVACEPTGKQIRLWSTGRTWKLFDLGASSVERYGQPYLMIHRGDLHRLLLDAARRESTDAVQVGRRCERVEQVRDRVRLNFADGTKVEADLVIGADGVHSIVRQQLFGEDRPYFTGCMAWRGLVPTEKLPERLREPVGTNWIGHGGHVVTYPVRRGELLNFVGIVERDDWTGESWTDAGTREECAADFEGWHEDVQEVIRQTDVPYKWALVGRDPMPSWVRGRVALLGDACHPTLPFLAQGANMALEDALVLARCMEAYPTVPEALSRYEAARIERTTKIVLGSADNARRFHNPMLAEVEGAEAYVDREWQEERVKARYDWLFEYSPLRAAI